MFKTNEKNFQYFEKCVKKWQGFFGLTDYRISVRHEKLKMENALASVDFDITDRWARIILNRNWVENPSLHRLERTAMHEMCHLLIAELESLTTQRFIQEDTIRRTYEAIVARLENFLVRFIKTKNGHH